MKKKYLGVRTKDLMTAALVGVSVLGLWAILGRRLRFKPIYDWNELITAIQGHVFVVRLPRGEYSVSSTDLVITSQRSLGTETQVVMVAPAVDTGTYTIKASLVPFDAPGSFPIEVVAHPASDFGDVPSIESVQRQGQIE